MYLNILNLNTVFKYIHTQIKIYINTYINTQMHLNTIVLEYCPTRYTHYTYILMLYKGVRDVGAVSYAATGPVPPRAVIYTDPLAEEVKNTS